MKRGRTSKTKLCVFEHADFHLLLEDYCQAKIVQGYSWRQISREADLGAPNFLQQVLTNKRSLNETHLQKLITFFHWEGDDAEYVRMLFLLQSTQDTLERNQIYQRILGLSTLKKVKILHKDQYDYFSDWIHPVVRELAVLAPDKSNAASWIGKRITPQQNHDRIQSSLDLLQRLGLIFPLRNQFKQRDKVVSTPSQAQSLLVGNFHRQVLAKAAESITSVPRDQRELRTITLTLTEAQQNSLRDRMDAFWKEVLHMCEVNQSSETDVNAIDVCQFSMQFFPYTRNPNHETA